MNVSDLSLPQLARKLRREGIRVRMGPFLIRIQSPLPVVAAGISSLYADYSVDEHDKFVDFSVQVTRPKNHRRWLKPQALFFLDGELLFKPLPLDQAFAMLEWGLNLCISSDAHQYLMVHGAVAEKGGSAAILPAPPGSGKSTLCAGLVSRGWRLLSDEIVMISLDDGRLVPLPRPVSLKNDSITVIRSFFEQAVMGPFAHDTAKGTVAHMKPPTDSVARAEELACPAWIIFPQYETGADTRLEPYSRGRSFMRMAENSFNYAILDVAGFHSLTGVIDGCECFTFTYSDLEGAVSMFDGLADGASSPQIKLTA